jgi:hypothetical protein
VRKSNLFFVVLSTTCMLSSCSIMRHEGKKDDIAPENKGPEQNQEGSPEKNPSEKSPSEKNTIQNKIPDDLKKHLQTIIESYAKPEDVNKFKLKSKIFTDLATNKVTSRVNYIWKDDILESFEEIKSAAEEKPEHLQYRSVKVPGCSWSFTPGQNLFSIIDAYQNRSVFNTDSYNPEGKLTAKTVYNCSDGRIMSSKNESYTDGTLEKVEDKYESFYTYNSIGLLEKVLNDSEDFQDSKEFSYVIENDKLSTVEVKEFERDTEYGDQSLKLKTRNLYDLKNRTQKSFLIDADTERETGETISYDMSVSPITVFQSAIYNKVKSSDLTGRICKSQVDAFICESKDKRYNSEDEIITTEKYVPIYAHGDVHDAVDSLSDYLGIPKTERYILVFARVKVESIAKSKATGKMLYKTVGNQQFNNLGKLTQYDYLSETYNDAGEISDSSRSRSVFKYGEGGSRLESVEKFKDDELKSKETYEY